MSFSSSDWRQVHFDNGVAAQHPFGDLLAERLDACEALEIHIRGEQAGWRRGHDRGPLHREPVATAIRLCELGAQHRREVFLKVAEIHREGQREVPDGLGERVPQSVISTCC